MKTGRGPLEYRSLFRITSAGTPMRQTIVQTPRGWRLEKGSSALGAAQSSAPGPRCSSEGTLLANRRGELLVKVQLPYEVCDNGCIDRRGRYALLDCQLHELWERDILEPSPQFNVAIGDDGSVLESGWEQGEDGSTKAYVARTR